MFVAELLAAGQHTAASIEELHGTTLALGYVAAGAIAPSAKAFLNPESIATCLRFMHGLLAHARCLFLLLLFEGGGGKDTKPIWFFYVTHTPFSLFFFFFFFFFVSFFSFSFSFFSKSPILVQAACRALGEIGQNAPLPLPVGEKDSVSPELTQLSVISELIRLAQREGKGPVAKVREAAIHALGLLGVGAYPHPHFATMLTGLCEVAKVKSIELQFTVGEALSCLAAGSFSTMAVNEWRLRKEGAPVRVPLPGDAMERTLDEIFTNWAPHGQAVVRQGAGVWLVSLLKFCGTHPAVSARLSDIQMILTDFLAEGDEFTQVGLQ